VTRSERVLSRATARSKFTSQHIRASSGSRDGEQLRPLVIREDGS
jgi:hypothetical protein